MTTVQIGSLTLSDSATAGWTFQKLTDWYTLPASKTPIRARPLGSHGAFSIDRDWLDSAAISVEGWFLGESLAECVAAKRSLASVGGGQMATVTVTDAEGASSRSVSIRQISILDDYDETAFGFVVDMIAPDPRRYGAPVTTSTGLPSSGTGQPWPQVWPADWGTPGSPGRVTATNTGTASTALLLTVAGGLSGGVELVAVGSGRVLRLERVIPNGSTVMFDAATGRVYLDARANDITGFLTKREWDGFIVPGGGSVTVQMNPLGVTSGTPTLTVQYAPAN